MTKVLDVVKPGVLFGEDVAKVYQLAKENQFAIPAVNVVGSDSINAVMEAAATVNSPVIIQFSNGGAVFNAGKGLKLEGQEAAIAGASVHTWTDETVSCRRDEPNPAARTHPGTDADANVRIGCRLAPTPRRIRSHDRVSGGGFCRDPSRDKPGRVPHRS